MRPTQRQIRFYRFTAAVDCAIVSEHRVCPAPFITQDYVKSCVQRNNNEGFVRTVFPNTYARFHNGGAFAHRPIRKNDVCVVCAFFQAYTLSIGTGDEVQFGSRVPKTISVSTC